MLAGTVSLSFLREKESRQMVLFCTRLTAGQLSIKTLGSRSAIHQIKQDARPGAMTVHSR